MADDVQTEQHVIAHWRALWDSAQLHDGDVAPNERHLVDILQNVWRPVTGLTVLEVGCGEGNISLAFAHAGASLICLDSAPRAVGHSMRRHTHRGLRSLGLVASGFRIPLTDDSVDVVVSGGLLEHFDQDLRARMLTEMRRVSRGCVIALVPNGLDPFYRFAKWHLQQTGRWPWGEEHSLQRLADEFSDAGMPVLYQGSYDFYNTAVLLRDALGLRPEQAQTLMKWASDEAGDALWCGYRLVIVGSVD